MPADLIFPLPRPTDTEEEGEYVEKLQTSMQEAHQVARKVLKQNVERMKRLYDVKLWTRVYKPGDAVYILNSATVKNKCRKLGPPWKGPGVVEERITPYLYRVKMIRGSVTINHDRMKICRDSILPAWIKRVKRQILETDNQQERETNQNSELYCLCHGPDDGGFMIQCDYCEEWFHGSCINLTAEEAKEIDQYLCPKCDSRSDQATEATRGGSVRLS